jgi:hypothetical protein
MHNDMKVIRRYVSDADFREALDHAPPGIIDPPLMGVLEFEAWTVPSPADASSPIWIGLGVNIPRQSRGL